jgi:succinate dehydrogenase / fumarate reductase cytochrome b subunit
MAASIFHRITGGALAVVGLAVLTWWLTALAGGSETYADFTKVAASIPGKIVLIGLTWALLQHLFSGIRHLVMDTGQGFELRTSNTAAIMTFVASALLTAALWWYLLGVAK